MHDQLWVLPAAKHVSVRASELPCKYPCSHFFTRSGIAGPVRLVSIVVIRLEGDKRATSDLRDLREESLSPKQHESLIGLAVPLDGPARNRGGRGQFDVALGLARRRRCNLGSQLGRFGSVRTSRCLGFSAGYRCRNGGSASA